MNEITGTGMSDIEAQLEELKQLGRSRRLRLVSGPQGPTVLLEGKPVLLLCSNNYLGLADHPRVREAAAEAAMRWGVGAGASRLVSGTMTIHRRLEERLAAFERSQACLLFGSGYLANIGVIGALAGRGDVILMFVKTIQAGLGGFVSPRVGRVGNLRQHNIRVLLFFQSRV